MRNDKLRQVFIDLGFIDVASVISSGNIIFSAPNQDIPELERRLEAAWPEKLGFTSTTIIRSQKQLQELLAKQPFQGYEHSRKTSLNVTFLQKRAEKNMVVPAGADYKVLEYYSQEICSVIDTTATKTPLLMAELEKTFGKHITTRTWATVQKILAKMG